MDKYNFHYRLITVIFDLLFLNISLLFMVIIIKDYASMLFYGERYFYLLLFFNFAWIIAFFLINRMRSDNIFDLKEDLVLNTLKMILIVFIISLIAFLIKEKLFSRLIVYGSILIYYFLNSFAIIVICSLFRYYIKKLAKKIRVLIIGSSDTAHEFYNNIRKDKDHGIYDIVGILDDDMQKPNIMGPKSHLMDIALKFEIDEIFINLSRCSEKEISNIISFACKKYIKVKIIPDISSLNNYNISLSRIGPYSVLSIPECPLDNYFNAFAKRIFDIIFSVLILIVLFPLFIIISIAVKLSSKGPVLYIANRVGYNGKPFTLYKFRTMYDKNGAQEDSARENDPRVFPLGGLLRKLSLDELPQFINVIKGNMSIVGPRPHRKSLNDILVNDIDKYMLRHYIRPGITGWAQINGWRGPMETDEQKEMRFAHDMYYIRNWSFLLDIKIIFMTVFSRKSHRNAF